jgi:hypothetical protein
MIPCQFRVFGLCWPIDGDVVLGLDFGVIDF